MTEFEKQLDAAIEKGSVWQDNHQFRMEPYKEITHADSFKAGANLLKPLISALIKQRNYIYAVTMDQKTASIRLKADNQELLNLIGDV